MIPGDLQAQLGVGRCTHHTLCDPKIELEVDVDEVQKRVHLSALAKQFF